jgi:PPP family 3-phenylpropionic acid transporter
MSIQPRTADPQAQAGAAAGAASSQPLLVLALVFAGIGCVHASHAGVYSFGSLHWRALGYSPDAIGVLWAIALLAEIALFFVFGALPRRLPLALALLAAGAVVAALRWALITVDLGPAGMALVQVLHAGSFGLAHLGGLAALNLLARPGTRSRAQGIVSSSVAIGVSAATYLCGRLFEVTGERAFAAMVPVALAGLVAFALAWRVSRR